MKINKLWYATPFVLPLVTPWVHRIYFENFMRALPSMDTGWAHFLTVLMTVCSGLAGGGVVGMIAEDARQSKRT